MHTNINRVFFPSSGDIHKLFKHTATRILNNMKIFFLTTMAISVLAVNLNEPIGLLFSLLETSACAALCYDDSCHTNIAGAACFCGQSTVISGCVQTDCGADILALVVRVGDSLCGGSPAPPSANLVGNGIASTGNPIAIASSTTVLASSLSTFNTSRNSSVYTIANTTTPTTQAPVLFPITATSLSVPASASGGDSLKPEYLIVYTAALIWMGLQFI